jgi:putative membrane protein
LGVFNVVLKPILILLTLPINILTLGLFTFVINALLALLISTIVEGFYIEGLLSAILFSIVLSVVSYALNQLITKTGNNDHRPRGQGGGRNSIEGEVVE